MIEIKICGITRREDALAACKAGADALGFIFYPPSPRFILPEQARKIIRDLPDSVCRVGVFVEHDPADLADLVDFCGLDLIQIHGGELSRYTGRFPEKKLIRAASPRSEEEAFEAASSPVRAVLIDATRKTWDGRMLYGGTGLKSDWELAAKIATKCRLILAGGLNADNAADAIEAVRPDALDFNSGLESEPGRKDPEKIRLAVEAVRRADRGTDTTKERIFSRA